MSSRVRPQSLDAGFGNMEKGNFVHDVMYRLHAALIEEGVARVTPENLVRCLERLKDAFDEVRAEHARNKTSSSAALVAHSALERAQVDEILPQLEAVVRYEAEALSPFAPKYLEYSFNGLGVEYAGRPLGGRIDRVDVDAEGRAVVIDYKHRTDVDAFKLADPTVAKRDGTVPADDPDWLPEHTQSLIYAQALRHSELALDARGALYFATKGGAPALRGAVSEELAEDERGDGRVPGLRTGFPDAAHGGSMGFDELLGARVERTVPRRLDVLEAGRVAASEKPGPALRIQPRPWIRAEERITMDLSTLMPQQRDIVTTLDRPLFVSAGAGSGKTFTLTRRILWALSPESGPFIQSLDQVLAITFTKDAAAEIRERVRGALIEAGMGDVALQVDDA